MKEKILITPKSFSQAGDAAYKPLREAGFEVVENKTGKTLDEAQLMEQCADIDGIIVGIDPLTEAVLKSAKKLKAISKYGAGLDNIDLKAAADLGIKVERAAGTNAVSVAELAIGLFFSLARSIPAVSVITKSGKWDRVKGVELTGKTVGIVGFGNIGREVARMASGLGMKVLTYDPLLEADAHSRESSPLKELKECIRKYSVKTDGLDQVIKEADFLTLHLPLTGETKHMINRDTLASMKKTAYLVNTARGELVDEDALYDALKNGVIAGAAEDVFSTEPPEGHKLLTLDNFLLTSHIGGFTVEAVEKMAVRSAINLVNMLKGE